MRLGVEHQRPQLAVPVALDAARRVAEALEPERVGEPLGRVDGDDDGAPAGRAASSASTAAVVVLPTPPDPAAHDDVGVVRRVAARSSSASTRSWQRRRCRRAARSASTSRSSGPRSALNRYGSCSCGSGSCVGQALHLLALQRHAVQAEVGRGRERRPPRRRGARCPPAAAAAAGSTSSPASSGYRPLTTTGPRLTPTRSSRLVGGLDQLVDRRLLRERHEHTWQRSGSVSMLEHVAGLRC